MRRTAFLSVFASLLLLTAVLLSLDACGGGGSSKITPPPPLPTIKHVVIIFQENRTPDNLFQDSVLIQRGADIAQSGLNSQQTTVPLAPLTLANDYDLDHHHAAFVAQYDGGSMDGADKVSILCAPNTLDCPPPSPPQFMYVNPAEVQPYFDMAEQYTFGDRMFQTHQGPSFPAHQFIISGTSAPAVGSDLFAAENPSGTTDIGNNVGCTAPPAQTVALIDPAGDESTSMYPCFEHPTLTDLLNNKGLSWHYYTPTPGSIWTAPNAIQHMCVAQAQGAEKVCTGNDWTTSVVLDPTQVLTDVANSQLPAVSWVIPDGKESDHPSVNDGSGPSWVASVVNAIGNSQYWSDTAIIVTWDDWGGWYDHVAPTVINSYEYGFRVPLIVISPYAKAKYISHQTHDFGSILKFIEETFSLPSLNYADATADNLSDCFNFHQTPLVFKTINAPLKADYFLHDKRPHIDPDAY